MIALLTSKLATYEKDENGNKIPIALKNENEILANIKTFLKARNRIVYVANFQNDFEENDFRSSIIFESFKKAGIDFKEKFVLDARNKDKAKEIVGDANLIILSGGKCTSQLEFFEEINLKSMLEKFNGVVIGISAGTMNLCETVANFPEDVSDISSPRWLSGLGFVNEIIIPHFDGETKTYQIECGDFDVVKKYIIPMSKNKNFLALPNGSYLLFENGKQKIFGVAYRIINKKIIKIN